MNNDKAAIDVFNSPAELALTDDDLLSVHGGSTTSGYVSYDSGDVTSNIAIGIDLGGGSGPLISNDMPGSAGGYGGYAASAGPYGPPESMQTLGEIGRTIEAVREGARDAGEWLLEKAGDAIIKNLDRSGITKTPFLTDAITPPPPEA